MRCREETLRKVENSSFDVCVIGGGATGAGSALDAPLRGLQTALVHDAVAGKSSRRSSKRETETRKNTVRHDDTVDA